MRSRESGIGVPSMRNKALPQITSKSSTLISLGFRKTSRGHSSPKMRTILVSWIASTSSFLDTGIQPGMLCKISPPKSRQAFPKTADYSLTSLIGLSQMSPSQVERLKPWAMTARPPRTTTRCCRVNWRTKRSVGVSTLRRVL